MRCKLLQSIAYEHAPHGRYFDVSFAIFSTKLQYPWWVWLRHVHFRTYPVKVVQLGGGLLSYKISILTLLWQLCEKVPHHHRHPTSHTTQGTPHLTPPQAPHISHHPRHPTSPRAPHISHHPRHPTSHTTPGIPHQPGHPTSHITPGTPHLTLMIFTLFATCKCEIDLKRLLKWQHHVGLLIPPRELFASLATCWISLLVNNGIIDDAVRFTYKKWGELHSPISYDECPHLYLYPNEQFAPCTLNSI